MTHEKDSLPLCAAENPISPFAKIPLDTCLQEKYIMGSVQQFTSANNFFEAEYLFDFYKLINRQCKDLFDCNYADPRALSGVNAVMVLLMSLFKDGDTILISSEESGGHSSMPLICKRLGISTIELPFDFDSMDFDYDHVNQILQSKKIDGILICPSDLLWQPHLELLKLPPECVLIYDATQTLGLMPHGINENPLDKFSEDTHFILMGATHKTLPGPTCGLIMTKDLSLAQRFDCTLNPDYLRNVHFHHILSLSLVLMEIEKFGRIYAENIVKNANYLGKCLEELGFDVIKGRTGLYTNTHQIFLPMSRKETDSFSNSCQKFGISLNARYKKLYRGSGIRIGVQEVTRYGWGNPEMEKIANILHALRGGTCNENSIKNDILSLANHKEIHYTFSSETLHEVNQILHNC